MNSDPDEQIPLLSIGFRPFFLAAGLYAIIAMLAWIAWLMLHSANAVILSPTIAMPAHLWHGHEMLFGFAAAVISGFMLTAAPGWTGARRVAGAHLMVLVVTWLAGRIVMWFSSFLPALLVAIVDMVHLPMLAGAIAIALVKLPTPRNLIFLVLLAILIAANGAVHLEWIGWSDDTASWGLTVALIDTVLLVVILGGRIVPSFTRNALMRRGENDHLPRSYAGFERTSIASVAILLICVIIEPPDVITGLVALIAALSNFARLALWRGMSVIEEPILWSLHIAYLWIPVGLAVLFANIVFDIGSQGAALHILGVGAIGGMTLAMMTRAPLGHTGRPLVVRRSITLAYVMLVAATLLRGFVLGASIGGYFTIILVAGGLWITGFAIFVAVYLPILVGPSLKAQAAD